MNREEIQVMRYPPLVGAINWNLPAVPADNFAFRFSIFDTHDIRPVSAGSAINWNLPA